MAHFYKNAQGGWAMSPIAQGLTVGDRVEVRDMRGATIAARITRLITRPSGARRVTVATEQGLTLTFDA